MIPEHKTHKVTNKINNYYLSFYYLTIFSMYKCHHILPVTHDLQQYLNKSQMIVKYIAGLPTQQIVRHVGIYKHII